MNEYKSNHETEDARKLPLDLLITRLADGDGKDADWIEFQRRAAESREPWQQLAEEQYIARRLREGFDHATRQAVRIELPSGQRYAVESHARRTVQMNRVEDNRSITRTLSLTSFMRQHGGWAVAALIILAWVLTIVVGPRLQDGHAIGPIAGNQTESPDEVVGRHMQESIPVGLTPDGYLQKYIEEAPHVERELPPLLLQARISKDGQEVIYMRRIIERRKTSGLFEITRDEHNNEVLVPKSLSNDPSSRMY